MSITEENKELLTRQRCDEITRAAKKLFYMHGFTSTSMDAIAAQAGISKGLIYYYFRSKEDLLLSFTDSLAEYLDELKQMADPLKALERFGVDFLVNDSSRFADAPPVQILLTTFANREIDVDKYVDKNPIMADFGRKFLGDLFQRAMGQGLCRKGDAGKFGDIYWSFLLGKLLTVKKGHESDKPDVYVKEILEVFRR